ncbi:MAG: acyl-CoA dehydrogenase family protein [Rhodobacteraceae bacterium]|nr:acyl-CoA dehydrogenase family protein [Paracoccaceae bacterium]
MPRPIFEEEHILFREAARRFVEAEIVPHHAAWEDAGVVPREIWLRAGEAGLLCPTVPEEWGGPGADFLCAAIAIEEVARVGASGPGFWIHSEMVAPYLTRFGSEAQKARWLPAFVRGEAIGAVAMSEPGAGSDLRGIRTRASRHGSGWRLSGQKVFISNGQLADLVVVAAQTGNGAGISLFLVPGDAPGFQRGRNLRKLGGHAQDTSELFFDEVELGPDALLGEEGGGFSMLMAGLARERLAIAVSCQAKAEAVLEISLDYAREREMFGQRLGDLQAARHRLALMQTEVLQGRAFVDSLLALHLQGALDATMAAAAKYALTEMLGRVADAGLQLHGGWGYMTEYPIARFFADARVERIAGGASEVMLDIVGKAMVGRR